MRKSDFRIFVFLVVWVTACVSVRAERNQSVEARAAIERMLPPIITVWNADKLIEVLHPDVLAATSRESIAQSFFLFKTLGCLSTYDVKLTDVAEKKVSVFKSSWIVTATIDAVFENAPARIDLCLIGDENRWFISRFLVDSAYFRKNSPLPEPKLSREELESIVPEILKQDELGRNRQIDKIYRLAELYECDRLPEQAIRLYEEALKTDPANVYYQNKLARLLISCGRIEDGVPRLQFVYQYAEDSETIHQAGELLRRQNIDFSRHEECPENLFTNAAVALIPAGKPELLIIEELRPALEKLLGMKVCILPDAIPLGVPDLPYAHKFISGIYTNMTGGLTELQQEEIRKKMGYVKGPLNIENQRRFIETCLSETGNLQTLENFRLQIEQMGTNGQYSIRRISTEMRQKYPFDLRNDIHAYIGVTEQNLLTDGKANICYGGTDGAYGIISYFGFSAAVTGETPNRPRLVDRLLKQAASSVCSVLSGPRCSQPYCARAYPRTLEQHDHKPAKLCSDCWQRLEQYKKEMWNEAMESEYLMIGKKFYDNGEFEKVYGTLSRIAGKTPRAEAFKQLLGSSCYMTGRNTDAEPLLLDVVHNNPSNMAAQETLGRIFFFQKRYPESIAHLALAGTNPEIIGLLGNAYWNAGECNKAMPLFKDAVERNPTFYNCFLYGQGLLQVNQLDDAIAYLKKSVELNPQYAGSHHQLGIAYARKQKYTEALKHFQTVSKLAPESADAWNNLGYFWYEQKEFPQALEYYEKALQCNPEYGLVFYNMALLYYRTKDYSRAWEYYQQAENKGYAGTPAFKQQIEAALRK